MSALETHAYNHVYTSQWERVHQSLKQEKASLPFSRQYHKSLSSWSELV